MIVILLLAIGAGLALAAQFTDTLPYGYAAVGVAVTGVLLVVMQAWRDHQERRRETETPQTGVQAHDSASATDAGHQALDHGETAEVDEESQSEKRHTTPVDQGPVPISVQESEADIVRVIPGRKRFHQPGCSQLAGRDNEELTRGEAEEEGFTPCSICCSKTKDIRKAV